MTMDIRKYIKPGKDIVIELDDEVEYLLNKSAIRSLKDKDSNILLIRLLDGKIRKTSLKLVIQSLKKNGVVDYIDRAK